MSDTAQLALTEYIAPSASAGCSARWTARTMWRPNRSNRTRANATASWSSATARCTDAEAVGHATVLTSALDLIRGQTFIELLDILVEPARNDHRRRAVELLAAVQKDAAAVRKPLLSNVVHLPGDLEAASRDWQLADTLYRTGWTEWDVYPCAELPRSGT